MNTDNYTQLLNIAKIKSDMYAELIAECEAAIAQNEETYSYCLKKNESMLAGIAAGALEQSKRFLALLKQNSTRV